MHYATNKEMMTGIGIATILVHCVGGSLTHGMNCGYTNFSSRSYGAQNLNKFKKYFVQGLTNLVLMLFLFVLIALSSYRIILWAGQTQAVTDYAYQTMIYHLPAFIFFYISDFLWSYLNSQNIFKPIVGILGFGLLVHFILSLTVSKRYGFNGIIISTNITFFVVLASTILVASYYGKYSLSFDLFKVQNPYEDYKHFVKECFYIAIPFCLGLFVFEFMTLYLGSFKITHQTAAMVAITNFQAISIAPHVGYSLYAMTKIGHYIG